MFISVEGADYSGKSTMCEVIREYFTARGREVLVTREPGGTVVGNRIRSILLEEDVRKDPLSVPTQILLFYAARLHHVNNVILPALRAGQVVLSDRYMDSSLVYQGRVFGGSGCIESLVGIREFKHLSIRPDYTLFFDIDYETMVRRKNGRGEMNALDIKHMEMAEIPIDCYKGHFYDLQNQYRSMIKIVDANESINQVSEAVQQICLSIHIRNMKISAKSWPLRNMYLDRVEDTLKSLNIVH